MIRIIALSALVCCAAPALAQDDDPFVSFRALKPEVALTMAQAAMEDCREKGYQVGVTVVDRSGQPQVFLRDRYAGAHVYETSYRKAWTSVSFRSDTSELNTATAPGTESYGIREIGLALPLGGGLLVQDGDGSVVAGIGVSGAPGPSLDDECAATGIAAVEDDIAF